MENNVPAAVELSAPIIFFKYRRNELIVQK